MTLARIDFLTGLGMAATYLITLVVVTVLFAWIRPRKLTEALEAQAVRHDSLRSLRLGLALFAVALVFPWFFGKLPMEPSEKLTVDRLLGLSLIIGLTALLVGIWCVVIDLAIGRASGTNRSMGRIVLPFLRQMGRFAIIVVGLVVALSYVGVNVAGILAGLGIGGVAIALASKDSIENFFGAFTILVDMPFGVGDWIVIGTIEGEVEEVGLRSTKIRTFNDSLITMPNSTLIKASVENMGRRRKRRLRGLIRFSPPARPAALEEFSRRLQESINEQPEIDAALTRVAVSEIAADGVHVKYVAYAIVETVREEELVHQSLLTDALTLAQSLELEIFLRAN